jgi:WD40 repeat protein
MQMNCRTLAIALTTAVLACLTVPDGVIAADPPEEPGAVVRLSLAAGTAACWNADGSLIVTAGGKDVQVWDGRTFDPVGETLHHDAKVTAAVFSPDGARVAAAAGRAAFVYDARTSKRLVSVTHDDEVLGAAFDASGSRLATASRDRTVRVWDAANGKRLVELRHDDPVAAVVFAPKREGSARLLTWTLLTDVPANVRVMSPTRGDALLWELDGDAPPKQPKWRFSGDQARRRRGSPHCDGRPVFSPDGTMVAIPAGGDGVTVVESATCSPLARWLPNAGMRGYLSAQFSTDGQRLLTGGDDGPENQDASVRVLELPAVMNADEPAYLEEIKGFEPNHCVVAAALSPDGSLVAILPQTSADAALYSVETGKEVMSLENPPPLLDGFFNGGPLTRVVAFSPDGRHLATATSADADGGVAKWTTIWRVPAGKNEPGFKG